MTSLAAVFSRSALSPARLFPEVSGGTKPAPAKAMIGVQAGGQYWLIDATDIGLAEVPTLAPVPLTRSWFRGLAVAEGALLGVVDLSAFTGGASTPVTHESRLVFLKDLAGSGNEAALLVGSLVGERAMSELSALPDVPDHDCTWAGARLRDGRGRLWQVINLRALFQHPEFQDICA